MMNLLQVMRTNGSVRNFRPDPVSDDAVGRVLDAARFAPSGGNRQAWHVIVLKDKDVRARIVECAQIGWNEYLAQMNAGVRPFAADETGRWPGPPPGVDLEAVRHVNAPWSFGKLEDAPVLMVVAADLREIAAVDADFDRTQIAGGASIYPFVQNILLAARTEGLAGVVTTFLTRQEAVVQRVLGLPPYMVVAAFVVLGVPEHQNTKLSRKPVAEFATVDRFDGAPFGSNI